MYGPKLLKSTQQHEQKLTHIKIIFILHLHLKGVFLVRTWAHGTININH